ncbi:beta-lactamase/transpeptidase-like protein [Aureobasidium subglaciale]|nr:beta-lactamase/transpeptidase-like protein [Aureobasidium subglaciale]
MVNFGISKAFQFVTYILHVEVAAAIREHRRVHPELCRWSTIITASSLDPDSHLDALGIQVADIQFRISNSNEALSSTATDALLNEVQKFDDCLILWYDRIINGQQRSRTLDIVTSTGTEVTSFLLVKRIQQLVDGVCASVPFFLGNRTKIGTVHDFDDPAWKFPTCHDLFEVYDMHDQPAKLKGLESSSTHMSHAIAMGVWLVMGNLTQLAAFFLMDESLALLLPLRSGQLMWICQQYLRNLSLLSVKWTSDSSLEARVLTGVRLPPEGDLIAAARRLGSILARIFARSTQMKPQDEIDHTDGSTIQRVSKACNCCRVKKARCSDGYPCAKCKFADAVCIFGFPKKSKRKVFPEQTLELQQFNLVTGLQTMYSMLPVADAWPGYPLPETKGHPLVHDMLERLGCFQSGDMELEIEDHGSDEDSDVGSHPRIQQNRGPSPTVRPRGTSASPRLGGNNQHTTPKITDLELGGWQSLIQSQSWSLLSQFRLPETDFTLKPPPKTLVPLSLSGPTDVLGWSAIDYMPPWWLGNLQPPMSNAVTTSVITTAQGDAYSSPAGLVDPTASSTYLVDPGKYGCDFDVPASQASTMSGKNNYIDSILAAVPHLSRGPGGVVAVVKDGKLLGQRAWGYADLDRRIPMTSKTQFPICSISKQMVCLVMVSLLKRPSPVMVGRSRDAAEQFEDELQRLLPNLACGGDSGVTVLDLCNMQSGIRDYWALTTLWGARPDGQFSLLHDAPKSLDRIKSYHFGSGTEYSYSNVNFHVLGRILENVSGMSLAQLLAERLFIPAGMTTASLCPNTNGLPLPIVGYEGNDKVGYFAASNRIEWAGDAGIAASLEDMIAYEIYLDRSLSDPESLYAQTSVQQNYRDGSFAAYGYGLARLKVAGKSAIAHGGALRGFRHMRMQLPGERLSFVIMHNFETTPGTPAEYVVKKVLNISVPEKQIINVSTAWKGKYLDEETQLYIAIEDGDREKPGTISVNYGPGNAGETARLVSELEAESDGMHLTLEGEILHVKRTSDNRVLKAARLEPVDKEDLGQSSSEDIVGRYRSVDCDSVFTVTGESGALYGCFDGFLGQGPIWLMRQIGKQGVWALGNPRGLDATPPGDWTVVFKDREDGGIKSCTVGCWLARNVKYVKEE